MSSRCVESVSSCVSSISSSAFQSLLEEHSAGFQDDEIALGFLEKSGEVVSLGCGVDEFVFASLGVENAAHRIELAEVESENNHACHVLLGLGSEIETDFGESASRV